MPTTSVLFADSKKDESEKVSSHSLICHDPVRAAGLEVADDLALAVNLNAAEDILRPGIKRSKSAIIAGLVPNHGLAE
jgi:hypothetical protein